MASKKRSMDSTSGEKNRKKAKVDDPEEEPVVVKCKTIFKKRLVERALQREEERGSGDEGSDDPHQKYYIRYSLTQDRFSIGEVEVIVDETEKRIRCSQCRFVTRVAWDKDNKTTSKMEVGIRNHIIGQHLGGYKCKQCEPIPVFHKSFSAHQKHVLESHNESRRELDAKVRASQRISEKADDEEGSEGIGTKIKREGKSSQGNSSDDSEVQEEFYPDGQRKLKRPWKCSYPRCEKRFHKVTRWKRHEEQVHGEFKGTPTTIESNW